MRAGREPGPGERQPSGHGGWITVGFDGSPAARSALRWAASLARPTVDRVALVVVVRPDPVAGSPHARDAREDRARAAADAALLDLRASHPLLAVRVSIRTGNAYLELDRAAPISSLLILGIAERRVGCAVPGPVARRALRSTAMPVALVPVHPLAAAVPRVVAAVAGPGTRAEVVAAATRVADRLGAEVEIVPSAVAQEMARRVDPAPYLAMVTARPARRGRGPASRWERRLTRAGCPVVVIADDDRPPL